MWNWYSFPARTFPEKRHRIVSELCEATHKDEEIVKVYPYICSNVAPYGIHNVVDLER